MSCYGSLAGYYDKLTGDVPYSKFIEFYEAEFARDGGEFRLLLDLCCGTGTLTCELARRGYEMIAADASVDMLMQAREKSAELPCPPLFLCQDAAELDLYGTVDAAVCSLDGMNYIAPDALPEVFHRLHPFRPPQRAAHLRYPDAGMAPRTGRGYFRRRKGRRAVSLARGLRRGDACDSLRHGYLQPCRHAVGARQRGAYRICARARRR